MLSLGIFCDSGESGCRFARQKPFLRTFVRRPFFFIIATDGFTQMFENRYVAVPFRAASLVDRRTQLCFFFHIVFILSLRGGVI